MIMSTLLKLGSLEKLSKRAKQYLPNRQCQLSVLDLLKKFCICGPMNGEKKTCRSILNCAKPEESCLEYKNTAKP
jgi:hypothetical protein